MNCTAHYHSSRSTVAFILFASALIVLMTSSRTAAQQKPRENRALYNSGHVTMVRRGNMIDVARSNIFTDFSDTINSTVSSGTIFNNSSTGANGGFFHLGTSATDAYWGAASSTGGSPFGTIANNAIYFGNRDNVPLQFLTLSSARMTIGGDGNIGIGTASPNRTLTVEGNNGLDVRSSAGYFVNLNYAYSSTAASLYALNSSGAVSSLLINPDGGNVGIGTTSPVGKFHVHDGTNRNLRVISDATGYLTTGMLIQSLNDAVSANMPLVFSGDPIGLMFGNVGIGTVSPSGKLQVNAGANRNLRVVSDAIGYGTSGIFVQSLNDAVSANMPLVFSGDPIALMYGNVGIGTTTVTAGYKLDVNGDTHVTGNVNLTGTINAKYQDLAEWVSSSEQLSAGTVVVLDSTKSNQVTSSSVGYDTRVAGVVSAQPGIALGEKSDGKVLVATTGRVRVKVDATKNPIHIGDLLVTSDIPGVAMKSEPVEFAGRKMHMPGTLIGKALEPLEKGRGTILVLLSLQ